MCFGKKKKTAWKWLKSIFMLILRLLWVGLGDECDFWLSANESHAVKILSSENARQLLIPGIH